MQYRGSLSVLTALARGEQVLLIVMGGGMSCVISLGVLTALVEAQLHTKPKACIGVSGGACNVASMLSHPERIHDAFSVYEHLAQGKFICLRWGMWGPQFTCDIDELIAALRGDRAHIDLPSLRHDRLIAQPIPFWTVATHAHTGAGVFLDAKVNLFESLRASMAIPRVCDPVTVGDTTLLDGAIGMRVGPSIRKVMARNVLVVMNRPPPGSRGWLEEFMTPWVTRMALMGAHPELVEAAVAVDTAFADELTRLEACTRLKTLVIHPDMGEPLQPWTSWVPLLRHGYTSAHEYTLRLIDEACAYA